MKQDQRAQERVGAPALSKLDEYITEYWPNPRPYLYDGIEEFESHDLSFYERFLTSPDFRPLGGESRESECSRAYTALWRWQKPWVPGGVQYFYYTG